MSGLINLQSLLAPNPTFLGIPPFVPAGMNSLLSSFALTPSYAPPQWIAVQPRFEQFHRNLALTPTQVADGYKKRASVVSSLNRAYYGTNSETDHSFFVGSWAKDTAIRPPRDMDIYFLLPASAYNRFQDYALARQSALLQELKAWLALTFPNTDMSGDGQVVVINFGTYSVEVVPAFELNTPLRYWICDTHNGGSYKETAPWAEMVQLETADKDNARNLRPLIRMLKAWQSWCSVPIKSFQLELVASEFLAQSQWRLNSFFYFDWITRDFFAYLYHRADAVMYVPGTFDSVYLGNDWRSRAASAWNRAVKACEYEKSNQVIDAGDEWQKIFGTDIPRSV
jgi:hypothetical protein